MSDHEKKAGFTAEELRESLSTFDPTAIGEATAGDRGEHPDASGKPELPGEQGAEVKRRQEQARPEAMPVRDDKLIHIGRGQSIPNQGGD